MTWHTATVAADGLVSLLASIRTAGGTIACSRPCAEGVRVTWTTAVTLTETVGRTLTGRS